MVVVTIYSYPCKGMKRQVFFDFSFLRYAKKSVFLTHLKSGYILFFRLLLVSVSQRVQKMSHS